MYLKDIVANYLPNIKMKNKFFVIGITGNIASGKSTFAEFLKQELLTAFPEEKIEIISTDDFLFDNLYLHQHNLFDEKGWEKSYDTNKISLFFKELIDNDKCNMTEYYSQKSGDIMPCNRVVYQPTILIIEGTMTLTPLFSHFIDYSIYLEVDLKVNYNWFEKRSLENLSSKKEYCDLEENEAINIIYSIWQNVNIQTFYKYAFPNKENANLCIELDGNHRIKYYNEEKTKLVSC